MYIILTAPNFRCAAHHHHQNRASKTSRRLSNHRGARKIKLIELFDIEKMAVENEMKESDGNRTEITNHIKSYSILCVCAKLLCVYSSVSANVDALLLMKTMLIERASELPFFSDYVTFWLFSRGKRRKKKRCHPRCQLLHSRRSLSSYRSLTNWEKRNMFNDFTLIWFWSVFGTNTGIIITLT